MTNKKLFYIFVSLLSATAITACTWWLPSHHPAQPKPPAKEEPKAEAPVPAKKAASAAVRPIKPVTGQRIINADREPNNWLSHGRTYSEQRYSPLNSINDTNVGNLKLAWYYDMPTRRGGEATSIVVDGVMYSTGPWSIVYALDAATGKELWKYDPQIPRVVGARGCCDVVNRGAAVWGDKVYVGVFDGRLVALNRKDGSPVWSTNTVENERYTITGAPRVVNGKVIIGNGGADWGVRGYVTAYDAETGKQAWRFYTVPGNPANGFESDAMKMAAKTWTGEWWSNGGGGTAWDAFAYDDKLNLLYIGVGNGAPWNRAHRSPDGGDNLFLSSIVAVKADTGEYVWHYQTTPGDSWDFTATQSLILADIKVNDQMRKVIMQAPKNGFFYVIDRETGEFISAKNFAKTTWASHVDPKTGRPVETENARYLEKVQMTFPTPFGGHNWHPMSYSPKTGLAYIPMQDVPFLYAHDPEWKQLPGPVWNTGQPWMPFPEDPEVVKQIIPLIQGRLIAWDPVKQAPAWTVDHPTIWNGGILSTAGNLVFQGTPIGQFNAFKADTGEKVWSTQTQAGALAGPITYTVNGEQYVSVVSGVGGVLGLAAGPLAAAYGVKPTNRVLTYKIGGTAQLPPMEAVPPKPLNPPAMTASKEAVDKGRALYHRHCFLCHGDGAISGGLVPDLRYSNKDVHALWDDIVINGALAATGMKGYADLLSVDDAQAIRAFVIKRAHDQIKDAAAAKAAAAK